MKILKSIFFFCLFISILIVFHELGHLITALLLGIQPKVFSIGFGPELTSIKFYNIHWQISAIPLGGYVSFATEDILANPGKWIIIGLAGPLFNFIQAFLLIALLFKIIMKNMVLNKVTEEGIEFSIKSNIMFTPQSLNYSLSHETLSKIGIQRGNINQYSYFKIITLWFFNQKLPSEFSYLLKKITLRHEPPSVSNGFVGPIGIGKLLGDSVNQSLSRVLMLNAQIAFGLGVFNCLPIPFLDGGKILQSSLMFLFNLNFESSLKISGIMSLAFIFYHLVLKRKSS